MQPITLDAVTLRPLAEKDLAEFNAIYTNADVRRHAEVSAAQPLTRLFLRTQQPPLELLLIELTETGELLGWCGLSAVPNEAQLTYDAEIFLKPSAQRSGIGAKVLNKLCSIASTFNYQVQARVHVENSSSQSLMKKLKWTVQKRLDQWEVWHPPVQCA